MQGSLPQIDPDGTLPPKPLSCVGTFGIDEDGYRITNEDGIVTAYIDKQGINWGVDIERYAGKCVELIWYPNAQVPILSVPPEGGGGDHASE